MVESALASAVIFGKNVIFRVSSEAVKTVRSNFINDKRSEGMHELNDFKSQTFFRSFGSCVRSHSILDDMIETVFEVVRCVIIY